MTHLSDEEHSVQMEAMKAFDEEMPSVGIFWYDNEEHEFFGVCKQEVTPKMTEAAAVNGIPYINYPHLHRQIWAKEYFQAQANGVQTKFTGDYTQIPRGRVTWNINKFVVFVGKWVEPIQSELTALIDKHFHLPYFEFVYDYHWDLGHGWLGDMK